jgi:hypothetical protein
MFAHLITMEVHTGGRELRGPQSGSGPYAFDAGNPAAMVKHFALGWTSLLENASTLANPILAHRVLLI